MRGCIRQAPSVIPHNTSPVTNLCSNGYRHTRCCTATSPQHDTARAGGLLNPCMPRPSSNHIRCSKHWQGAAVQAATQLMHTRPRTATLSMTQTSRRLLLPTPDQVNALHSAATGRSGARRRCTACGSTSTHNRPGHPAQLRPVPSRSALFRVPLHTPNVNVARGVKGNRCAWLYHQQAQPRAQPALKGPHSSTALHTEHSCNVSAPQTDAQALLPCHTHAHMRRPHSICTSQCT